MMGAEAPQLFNRELMAILEANGFHNPESAKRDNVWSIDNKSSVISIIKEALHGFSLPYPDGHDDTGYDSSGEVKRILQILNEPLSYIKDICGNSRRLGYIAGAIVSHGGIDHNEAQQLVNKALELNGLTRQDLASIANLPDMAKKAFSMLEASGDSHKQMQRKVFRDQFGTDPDLQKN